MDALTSHPHKVAWIGDALTCVAIIAAAAWLVLAGGEILLFDSVAHDARARLDEPLRADASAVREARAAATANLMKWRSTPGFSGYARRLIRDLSSPNEAERDVIDILTVDPTDGEQWLELARLQYQHEESITKVRDALQMSLVTRPHEAALIERRVPFMLKIFEFLSEDEQKALVNQVVEMDGRWEPATVTLIRAIVTSKPDATRAALARALAAQGVGKTHWAHVLGF